MKTLILGGTGLLGQHAAVALLERGHEPTLVGTGHDVELLPGLGAVPRVRLDAFASPEALLRSVFEGHEALIYALGPDDREPRPAPAASFFQRMLVEQTERILTAAREAGVTRAAVCGSYFATWERMHAGTGFADRHPYVRARVDQTRRAVAAGGGQAGGGVDVCVLAIPYVFGVVPGREPMWKEWLYDRLRAMPVVFYPTGGSSVVTAAQVGEALAGAIEAGAHGGRYPLADEQLTWASLLGLILPRLGKSPRVVGVPRLLAEPTARSLGRDLARRGMESGVAPAFLMRDIMYAEMFVDPAESQRVLGYRPGGVEAAIAASVAASYPGGLR